MQFAKLTLSQSFSHYLLPLTLTVIGLIPLFFWVTGRTTQFFPPFATILSGLFILFSAILAAAKQKSNLKFYSITSDIDTKTKNIIVRDILRKYKWTFIANKHNFIQAEGFGFNDKFDLRTWSEFITITIDKDSIKINSICNPNDFLPQAITSFGKNKQNISDFEKIFFENLEHNQ